MPESAVMEARVKQKSFSYRTHLEWVGRRGGVLGSKDKPSFRVSSPPEFKGEAGIWTPEDLFVGAVNVCTLSTFLAFAERVGLGLECYASEAEGVMELVDGGYRFTRVVVRPRIVVSDPETVETAIAILHDAHHKCIIANSIRAEVVLEPVVTATQS